MNAHARGPERPRPGGVPSILFVVDALSHNGAVFLATDLAANMRYAGSQAEIFALLPLASERRIRVDPSVTVTLGTSGRSRFRWQWPRAFGRLVAACRRAGAVVAVSEVGPALVLASLAARVARRPFIVMVHAELDAAIEQWVPRRLRQATRVIHRRADAAACVSEALVSGVVANGLDASRVHIVPPGIDTHRIQMLARERESLPPSAVPRVVALGRLSVEKGFDVLVRAHAKVRAAGAEHELVVIGEGPLHEELRALAGELRVGDSVRLPGLVPNPFPILAGGTVFVLSSRREGLPLALLEALALGVPVIATRCAPSVETALGDGAVGDLVEPGSVDALADALSRHLARPERLRAHGAHGAARARSHDIGESAARLADLARRLVDARRDGGSIGRVREATYD